MKFKFFISVLLSSLSILSFSQKTNLFDEFQKYPLDSQSILINQKLENYKQNQKWDSLIMWIQYSNSNALLNESGHKIKYNFDSILSIKELPIFYKSTIHYFSGSNLLLHNLYSEEINNDSLRYLIDYHIHKMLYPGISRVRPDYDSSLRNTFIDSNHQYIIGDYDKFKGLNFLDYYFSAYYEFYKNLAGLNNSYLEFPAHLNDSILISKSDIFLEKNYSSFPDYLGTREVIRLLQFIENLSIINKNEYSRALILSTRIDFYLSHNPYKSAYQRAKSLAYQELTESKSTEFQSLFFLLVHYLFEHDEKLKWTQKILEKGNNHLYYNNLLKLRKDLIRPHISFQLEREMRKGENQFIKFDITNTDKIFIFRKNLSTAEINEISKGSKVNFDQILPYESFQIRTESGVNNQFYHYLKTADLDYGYYAFKILALNAEQDTFEITEFLKITDFEILNISNDQFFKLLVLNKQNAKPYKKVEYTIGESGPRLKLAKDGIINFLGNGNARLHLYSKNDSVNIYNHVYFNKTEVTKSMTVLTEKNIYRRGQLIRGKLIFYQNDKGNKSIFSNQSFKLELIGRAKILNSIQVKTNDFGSAEFSYLIPNDYSGDEIVFNAEGFSSYYSVRVEDYKRPRFELLYDEQSFEVKEDSVVAVFYLKSFSGINPEIQNAEIKVQALLSPSKWVKYPHFTKEIIGNKVFIKIKKYKNTAISNIQEFYEFNIEVKLNDFTGETFESYQQIGKVVPQITVENLKAEKGQVITKLKLNNLKQLDGDLDSLRLIIENIINIYDPRVKWVESNFKTFINKEELEKKFNNKFKIKPLVNTTYDQQIHKIDDSSFLFVMNYLNGIDHISFKIDFEQRKILQYQTDPIILFDTIIQFKKDLERINYLTSPKTRDIRNLKNSGDKTVFEIASHYDENLFIYFVKDAQFKLIKSLSINDQYKKIELKHDEFKGSNQLLFIYYSDNAIKNSIYYELINNPVYVERILKESEIKIKSIKQVSGDSMEIEIMPLSSKPNENYEILLGIYDKSLNYFVNNNFNPLIYDYYPLNVELNSKKEYFYLYSRIWQSDLSLPVKSLPIFSLYDYSNFNYRWGFGDSEIENEYQMMASPSIGVKSKTQPPPAAQISAVLIEDDIENMEGTNLPVPRSSEEKLILFQSFKIKSGETKKVVIKVPEVLSDFRIQSFAHSKDLEFDYSYSDFTSYKPLAILPQWPRFIRKGEIINFSSRISNETDSIQNIKVSFYVNKKLFWDTSLMIDKKSALGIKTPSLITDSLKGIGQNLRWEIRSQNFYDAEQIDLALLSNQVLVINSIDYYLKTQDPKTQLVYEDLGKSLNNPKHKIEKLAIEITTNPAWLALINLGIPQGNEENLDYWLNKYYLISSIQNLVKKNPGLDKFIREKALELSVGFAKDPANNLLSQNLEWKNLVLSETPWELEAENEKIFSDQLIIFLNDQLNTEVLENCLEKINEFSDYSGAFTWIKGSPYYSYYQSVLVANYLSKSPYQSNLSQDILNKVKAYISKELLGRLKSNKGIYSPYYIDIYAILYLKDEALKPEFEAILNHYFKEWPKLSVSQMLAYSEFLEAVNKKAEAKKLYNYVKSLYKTDKDNAIYLISSGVNGNAFSSELSVLAHTYQLSLAQKDFEFSNKIALRILKLKRSNKWQFNQGTVDAALCLLNQNPNLESPNKILGYKIGDLEFSKSLNEDISPAYGTGYFKTELKSSEIKKGMESIEIYNAPSPRFASEEWKNSYSFVSVYYSYKAKMQDVLSAGSSLTINKVLYLESPQGNIKLKDGDTIKLGSKILVSLEIQSSLPLNYVYAYDKKASGVESSNTLSAYRFGKNLYWYEKSMDQEQRFFINSLAAGKSQIVYSIYAQSRGVYFMGTAGIASFYAPEYSGTSAGIRLVVID